MIWLLGKGKRTIAFRLRGCCENRIALGEIWKIIDFYEIRYQHIIWHIRILHKLGNERKKDFQKNEIWEKSFIVSMLKSGIANTDIDLISSDLN